MEAHGKCGVHDGLCCRTNELKQQEEREQHDIPETDTLELDIPFLSFLMPLIRMRDRQKTDRDVGRNGFELLDLANLRKAQAEIRNTAENVLAWRKRCSTRPSGRQDVKHIKEKEQAGWKVVLHKVVM